MLISTGSQIQVVAGRKQLIGGAALLVGWLDACYGEHLADDLGAVGAVLVERLARPSARD